MVGAGPSPLGWVDLGPSSGWLGAPPSQSTSPGPEAPSVLGAQGRVPSGLWEGLGTSSRRPCRLRGALERSGSGTCSNPHPRVRPGAARPCGWGVWATVGPREGGGGSGCPEWGPAVPAEAEAPLRRVPDPSVPNPRRQPQPLGCPQPEACAGKRHGRLGLLFPLWDSGVCVPGPAGSFHVCDAPSARGELQRPDTGAPPLGAGAGLMTHAGPVWSCRFGPTGWAFPAVHAGPRPRSPPSVGAPARPVALPTLRPAARGERACVGQTTLRPQQVLPPGRAHGLLACVTVPRQVQPMVR